jgi:hypothetical protein
VIHPGSRQSVSFRMDDEQGGRPRRSTGLRKAFAASPLSRSGSIATLGVIAVITLVWARPEERALCVLFLIVAVSAYLAALPWARSEFVTVAVVCAALCCGVSDLPVGRSGAVPFGALAGAVFLCFVELATHSLEPPEAGRRLHGPAVHRTLWTAGTAVIGGVGGWLLLSLRQSITGLGLIALGIGAGAAVLVAVLVAALARGALGDVTQSPSATKSKPSSSTTS